MNKKLLAEAVKARKSAYAPYSGFKVGAAILTADGKIYTGCNVENASFGGTICAERTAAVKAVSEGSTKFTAIAVCASQKPVYPCGICLQFLCEFAESGDMQVICASAEGSITETYKLSELMPKAFTEFK